MRLTKYEHACFTVEIDNQLLVVDAGNMTDDLPTLTNIAAIVVTHEHSDHFDPMKIETMIANNPDAVVYGPADVVSQLNDSVPSRVVYPDDSVVSGSFTLEFFGGEHQKPFRDSPTVANVAILINEKIYHASDSFVNPGKAVDTLLLPVSGSWMSSQMARDFLFDIKPRLAIPSHDAILSDKGKKQVDKYWPLHCKEVNATYLRPTTAIEL